MAIVRTLKVGDETLLMRQAGHAGPCVLLIHSLGTSSELWVPQLCALEDSFQVLAIDARGHGGSSNLGGFTVEKCANDALEVLTALDISEVHLVGISMGGLIAAELASLMKDQNKPQCKSIVLACSYRSLKGPQSQARLDATRAVLSHQNMASFAETYIKETACASMPADTRKTLERCIAGMTPDNYLQTLAEILFHDAGPALSRLQDIPALVLSGALDRRVSSEALASLLEAIPGHQHVWLESAGHLANAEDPAGFTASLVNFWTSLH